MNWPWALTPLCWTKIKINVRIMVIVHTVNVINLAKVCKRKVRKVGVNINTLMYFYS